MTITELNYIVDKIMACTIEKGYGHDVEEKDRNIDEKYIYHTADTEDWVNLTFAVDDNGKITHYSSYKEYPNGEYEHIWEEFKIPTTKVEVK